MSPDIEPSQYCAAVTASDSTSLMRTINGVEYAPRSIYVGSTGNYAPQSVAFPNQ